MTLEVSNDTRGGGERPTKRSRRRLAVHVSPVRNTGRAMPEGTGGENNNCSSGGRRVRRGAARTGPPRKRVRRGQRRWKENTERGTHLAPAEPSTEAQPKDTADLSHGGTGLGAASFSDGTVRKSCRAGLPHAGASDNLLSGCTKNVGIGVRSQSERVYGVARSPR